VQISDSAGLNLLDMSGINATGVCTPESFKVSFLLSYNDRDMGMDVSPDQNIKIDVNISKPQG
jgi:hypothetical protein